MSNDETWSNRELNTDTNRYYFEILAGLMFSPWFVANICVTSRNLLNPEYVNNITGVEAGLLLVSLIGPVLIYDGVRRVQRNNRHWKMWSKDHNN